MPIEGPLREFGIHDVFQLLDMSRKTGVLRLTSELKDEEGRVYFEGGKVVHAGLRSRPDSIEELLVDAGRITDAELQHARKLVAEHGDGSSLADTFVQAGVVSAPELERLMRSRLEGIVYELLAWRKGFFSFEERALADVPPGARVTIATESLLMEGARRIDEWSRIADKIPNLTVVPALAPVSTDHESHLDLLPREWEVLTMIDGARDVRAIAEALGGSEFDTAKIVYGLTTTGVVEIKQPRRLSMSIAAAEPAPLSDADLAVERGFAAAENGDLAGARAAFERVLALAPTHADAARVRVALDSILALQRTLQGKNRG